MYYECNFELVKLLVLRTYEEHNRRYSALTTSGFKRKLSAILMADVVGYSRLMGENETTTLQTLTTYQGVMEGLIRQHRGRVVDAPGDAVLAEFSSVVDAVQCAVAVQKELEARNAELPENGRMQFRIGINLGDVIEEGEKIYGDGVNIAARLEALAEPGGICISKTAFDHIETKLPLGYEFLGEKTVKNIARPVGAYRVLLEPRITVAGMIDTEKTQRQRHRKAVIAGAVVLLMAGISLAAWKFGFFSPQPEKQIASTSLQPPAPKAEETTPLPPAASPPSAVRLPKKPAPPPAASPTEEILLPKKPAPPPIPPRTEAVPSTARIKSFFRTLDTNNDGKISLSEFMTWRDGQFESLDTNKDGSLSRAEILAGKTRFARLIMQNFDLIDSNQDQMLSRAEFREAGRRRFIKKDNGRDGYLTENELAEVMAVQ
jgi:adenylate cyclase